LSKLKKYHLSGNLKFNNLGIPHSLKLRNLMGNILRILFKLNFTPNTLGCYGLIQGFFTGNFQLRDFQGPSLLKTFSGFSWMQGLSDKL